VRWWKILDATDLRQMQSADACEQRVVAWKVEAAAVI
jgi:hypothetical protein